MGSFQQQLFNESISAVTATKPAGMDLGTIRWKGGNMYRYVYNGGNSQVPPGYGVRIMSGVSDYTVTISSVSQVDKLAGIVNAQTLTTSTYGWLLTNGKATFVADLNSHIIGRGIMAGTNGAFQVASAYSDVSATLMDVSVCGYALQSCATSADSGVAKFNFI